MKPLKHPRVFISYAHEGSLQAQVKNLADWLTEQNIEVITDHPYSNRPPAQGWRAWMQHNIEDADVVLIVCSERYKRLFEKREVPDTGGRGVTWESAIITDELYEERLHNQRFFPILPDDGKQQHVPRVLRDWNNSHFFPSGNQGILSLIRDEIRIPKPQAPFQALLPSELIGSNDSRLQAREGEVIGRTHELGEVLQFLNSTLTSAAVCGHVTGSGGIGKTEVCKAALKIWLEQNSHVRAFFIMVSDTADSAMLLRQLGEAIGLTKEQVERIVSLEQLHSYLPTGLYYLDNLEHVADSPTGLRLLRELSQLPHIRLLASSRIALDSVFGRSISIGRLDRNSAYQLFVKAWNGKPLLAQDAVLQFVDKELGGHPLSISLLARLGRAYSWDTLQARWRQLGTSFAKTYKASERLDSLEISFALTRELLAQVSGALDLWQFIALFPEGCKEHTLEQWESLSGYDEARLALFEHHILHYDQEHISMLPPLARYALNPLHTALQTESNQFCWANTRQPTYQYFIDLIAEGAQTASSERATHSRIQGAEAMPAIGRLFSVDQAFIRLDPSLTKRLNSLLSNTYQFNASAGIQALSSLYSSIKDGLITKLLGDLESRLGQIEQARAHYDQAIQLYQQEQDQLGLANVLQSQADLLLATEEATQALLIYEQALSIYQDEQVPSGQAYTLAELLRCHHQLGYTEKLPMIGRYAINAAIESNTPDIIQYVLGAIYEAFNQDEEQLRVFLESCMDET
ncbi:MAG: TIR domain-containing protein [Thiothrix sp.]|nr:MAG: TIR domain-containing protein [Thiothrix sp.]